MLNTEYTVFIGRGYLDLERAFSFGVFRIGPEFRLCIGGDIFSSGRSVLR